MDLELIQFLFEHRTGPATALFQLATLAGEIEGFILVVSFIYVAHDKQLAIRLSLLALVAMSLNHVLKTLIANPRPFVDEGTWGEKWAVSPAKGQELAAEYSTPSGHAIAASSFYTGLFAGVARRPVRILAIVAIVLTGLSRPYLGVHYFEDVLLGWALGIPIALLSIRFGRDIGAAWSRRSLLQQLLIVVGSSFTLWLATHPFYAASALGPPPAFLSYTGFLAGVVFAFPLEERWGCFDPRSSNALFKLLRFSICVGLVLGTLLLLDRASALVASDSSPLGNLLRYLRYATAAVTGILLAPMLFLRLRLASPLEQPRTGLS